MPDITKCNGDGCPIKTKCYRFTSESDGDYQSFFVDVTGKWCDDVLNGQVWECDMFWGEVNEQILNKFKYIFK